MDVESQDTENAGSPTNASATVGNGPPTWGTASGNDSNIGPGGSDIECEKAQGPLTQAPPGLQSDIMHSVVGMTRQEFFDLLQETRRSLRDVWLS
jgi:hypothetical protein